MNYLLLFILSIVLYACDVKPAKIYANAEKRQYTVQQNPVGVIILSKSMFRKELVNNGKLVAYRKSELQFRVGEQLVKLGVRNGDPIKAGQVIAELNTFVYRQQLTIAISYICGGMTKVSMVL